MKNLIQIFEQTLDLPEAPPKKASTPATSTQTPTSPDSTTPTIKPPSFKIKPSSLGSKCLRKAYYTAASVPEDYGFDLKGKKRMKLGDAIHEMLHSVFKKSGILIEYYNPDGSINKDWKDVTKDDLEFPLSEPDLYIKKGKIDAVLKMEDGIWLGEYKSINENGFSSLAGPKEDHIIQAVIYFFLFNRALAEGKFAHIKELEGVTRAQGIRWLYVNKNDTEMKEFTMTQADQIFVNIVNKITVLKNLFDTKTLPPKTQDWCNSCNWRDKCKKNYNIS